jgi:aspartate racemase
VFEPLAREANAKMVSIIDALAEHAQKRNLKKLLLLGTKTTMSERFYRERLEKYGISTVVPEESEQQEIDRIISEELSMGNMKSAAWLESVVARYADEIDAAILGCTELPLAIKNAAIPLLDTAKIHVEKLMEEAMKN